MEAVAVFFVLSGFLVGGQVLRQSREGRFVWAEFLIKRLSRLWTVLVPGLVVTWASWQMIMTISPEMASSEVADHSNLAVAFCNTIFLQEAWCSSYSVNSSLWSLSYEFWFYIVFAGAVAALAALSNRRWAAAVANVAVVVGSIALFGPSLLALIPAWLLGILVVWCSERPNNLRAAIRARPHSWLVASLVLLGLTFVISNVLNLERAGLTVLVAIPSALLILAAILVDSEPAGLRRPIDVGVKMGHWSFSVYVFHLPFVLVISHLLDRSGWITGLGLPVTTYGLVLVAVPFAWVMWWFSERHTARVRLAMLSYLKNRA